MKDVYEIVTEQFIESLESGKIPWQKPWVGRYGGMAWSHTTGKPYSFLNQVLLNRPGEYITFAQAKKEGGHVKRGAKGKKCVFWKVNQYMKKTQNETAEEDSEKGKTGKRVSVPMLRYYTVFHLSDVEGIQQKYHTDQGETFDFVPLEEAERVACDYMTREGIKLEHESGDRASYNPGLDTVTMPLREQFPTSEGYYATLYHELTHSTGHLSRLNRITKAHKFGSHAYSEEELCAEMGSAFAMAKLGIDVPDTVENAKAYIQNWIQALNNDKRMVVYAATRAEKAVKMIFNETDDVEEETDNEKV